MVRSGPVMRMVPEVVADPSPSATQFASVVMWCGCGACQVVGSEIGDGWCPMGFASHVSDGGVRLPVVKFGEFLGPNVGGDASGRP